MAVGVKAGSRANLSPVVAGGSRPTHRPAENPGGPRIQPAQAPHATRTIAGWSGHCRAGSGQLFGRGGKSLGGQIAAAGWLPPGCAVSNTIGAVTAPSTSTRVVADREGQTRQRQQAVKLVMGPTRRKRIPQQRDKSRDLQQRQHNRWRHPAICRRSATGDQTGNGGGWAAMKSPYRLRKPQAVTTTFRWGCRVLNCATPSFVWAGVLGCGNRGRIWFGRRLSRLGRLLSPPAPRPGTPDRQGLGHPLQTGPPIRVCDPGDWPSGLSRVRPVPADKTPRPQPSGLG